MKLSMRFTLILTIWFSFPSQLLALDQTPLPRDCNGSKETYLSECLINSNSSGWNTNYKKFAETNKVTRSGGVVQFLPSQAANPYKKVAYMIGPYAGSSLYLSLEETTSSAKKLKSESSKLASWGTCLGEEIERLNKYYPFVDKTLLNLLYNDISVLFIGFGHPQNDELPLAARVAVVKKAVKNFSFIRQIKNKNDKPPLAALVGFSVGGVVGKIALRELEIEHNIEQRYLTNTSREGPRVNDPAHDVGLFVSLDSPHQGFTVPSSIQYLPIYLKNAFSEAKNKLGSALGVFGELFEFTGLDAINTSYEDAVRISELDEATVQLERAIALSLGGPLAQDLLVNNLLYENQQSPNISYIKRKEAMPRMTKLNVGITSSAINGSILNLGERYFKFNTGTNKKLEGGLRMEISANIPDFGKPSTFDANFYFHTPRTIVGMTRPYNFYARVKQPNPKYERTSCSWEDKKIGDVQTHLEDKMTMIWPDFKLNLEESRGCFIPMSSSLSLFPQTTENMRRSTQRTIIVDGLKTAKRIPNSHFDIVLGDSENRKHLIFSENVQKDFLHLMTKNFAIPKDEVKNIDDDLLDPLPVACEDIKIGSFYSYKLWSSGEILKFMVVDIMDSDLPYSSIVKNQKGELIYCSNTISAKQENVWANLESGLEELGSPSEKCIDEDGDGWGWNGKSSCQVKSQDEKCIDADGDGWGWDGSSSCQVGSKKAAFKSIDSQCIDLDGDGWGWDGNNSCKTQ